MAVLRSKSDPFGLTGAGDVFFLAIGTDGGEVGFLAADDRGNSALARHVLNLTSAEVKLCGQQTCLSRRQLRNHRAPDGSPRFD